MAYVTPYPRVEILLFATSWTAASPGADVPAPTHERGRQIRRHGDARLADDDPGDEHAGDGPELDTAELDAAEA